MTGNQSSLLKKFFQQHLTLWYRKNVLPHYIFTIDGGKMTEAKLDPRVIRTREANQSVFKKMVCELPYERITVKAITDKAKINRNTFYLHYTCVDDVLAEIQSKHSSEYSAIVSRFDQLKDTDKLVRSFFEYMEAQDDFFKRVTCDSRFDYIRERMQNRVTKQAAESHPM